MQRIRLLSYNIQAGIYTRQYSEYLTNSWKHLLPHRERQVNLGRIADMLRDFDLVGLQEVDAGSLRSSFVDQIEYLADQAQFPFWYRQVNRNLGKLAQHSNGVLSRLRPTRVIEHKLPGLPGRGAVIVEMNLSNGGVLGVCILHLALGWRARGRQLRHITQLIERYPYLVVMGDFNCDCRSHSLRQLARESGLQGLDCELKTFPSWRPRRNLDHILVSGSLRILEVEVLDYVFSDHLPLSMTVALPSGVHVL
jgi:endonuclease/exonuclease/phosphatase family metal-dependent hydrolase